jgi:hypothetical protein
MMKQSRHAGIEKWGHELYGLYERSTLAALQRHGAANTGGAYGGDYTSRIRTDVGAISTKYDAIRGVSPGMPRTTDELMDHLRMWGYTYIPAPVRKIWQLYKEALDIVSNSPQSALWRHNVGDYEARYLGAGKTTREAHEALARRVRQSGGDPSISGSHKTVQAIASAVPWGNVVLQAMNTWGKAIRENPWGTGMTIALAAIVPALIRAYSAIITDEHAEANGEQPYAVQDAVLGSTNATSTGARVYIPGLPAEAALRIPFEPSTAPIDVFVQNLVNKMFSLDDPRHFSGPLAEDKEVLKRIIEEGGTRALYESATRAFGQIATPPGIAAIGALRGTNLDDMFSLGQRGGIRSMGGGAPGFESGKTFEDPVNATVGSMLEALAGSGLATVISQYRVYATVEGDPQSRGKGFDAARETRALAMEDRLNMAPPLWSGPQRVSAYDIAGEAYREAEDKMQIITKNRGDWTRHGTIGAGASTRIPMMGPGRSRVGSDAFIGVLQSFDALNRQQAQLREQRDTWQTELRSLRSNGYRMSDPRSARMSENTINERIRYINQQLYSGVVRLENKLSRETGLQIRLEDIDFTRGMEQFGPNTPQ